MNTTDACWQCAAPFTSSWPFCDSCDCLQPCPDGGNPFAIMGIEPTLALDEEGLTTRFFELSRQFHPDFFGQASQREQEYSLAHSARLNDAYRVLQSFKGRVEWYLESHGLGEALAEWRPPPAMLMQVLEWNEELDELTELDGDDRKGRLESLIDDVQEARTAIVNGVSQRAVSGEQAQNEADTTELLDMVGRIQYISRLLERIENIV